MDNENKVDSSENIIKTDGAETLNKSSIDKFWDFVGNIMRFVINLFLKPFGKKLSDKTYDFLLQFVKFGVIGVSNTIVSMGIHIGALYTFRKYGLIPDYDYNVAYVISFVLSVLWSFYWNNKIVFILEEGKKRSWWKALLKTYISYSFTGLFLNSILLVLWVKVCGISAYIAPVVNIVINVPINFLINKFWAFSSKNKDEKENV